MNEQSAQSLIDSLIASALNGRSETELLEGLCRRLVECGLPLFRVSTASEQLHPLIGGQGCVWWRNFTTEQPSFPRRDSTEGEILSRQSPFDHLFERGVTHQRFDLDDADQADELPVLAELKQAGATDYFAIAMRIGEGASLSAARDIAFSWCTDNPAGFTGAELEVIERVAPALALAVNATRNAATGRFLLATYIGADAAERVLSGNIVRGRTDAIEAVIWFSDLADFTRLSDEASGATILALLDDYMGMLCGTIHANGGKS